MEDGRWFIEWESGRTDIVDVYGRNVTRNNKREVWPTNWSPKIISAIRLPSPQVTNLSGLLGQSTSHMQNILHNQANLGNALNQFGNR